MLELLSSEILVSDGVTSFSERFYISNTYKQQVSKLIEYYHDRLARVKGQNILNQILYNIHTPYNFPDDEFIRSVSIRAPFIANHFKLTSYNSVGIAHQGKFFGAGVDEFIIHEPSTFSITWANEYWENLRPVNILYSPKNDLDLQLLNGKASSDTTGIAVITINILMLAFQYKKYLEVTTDTELPRDSSYFIQRYVLPNILGKQLDYSIMNRFCNIIDVEKNDVGHFRHPITLVSYTDRVDALLSKVYDYMAGRNMTVQTALRHIPAAIKDSQWEVQRYNLYPGSLNSNWVFALAKIKYLRILATLGGDEFFKRNRSFVNDLQRSVRYAHVERIISETNCVRAIEHWKKEYEIFR